ncbi:MAG: polymer-forming cytoskeletal protein [Phycisphaerae bacterium]|nr:polymer-forming cytoskeletal protein [Phycisphaerae bacterium]
MQFPKPIPAPTRTIQCYHCGRAAALSVAARSTTCAGCYRGLTLDDLVVSGRHLVAKVQTCGRVVVESKGCLIGTLIHAQGGLDVAGRLVGSVQSAGTVAIRHTAEWEGDVSAPVVVIERGARVSGRFHAGTVLRPEASDAPALAGSG